MRPRRWPVAIALVLVAAAASIWWDFSTDLARAKRKALLGSRVINTPCGLIEYQEAGTGAPLLSVHGSGGGFDQGMAFAAPLATGGIRVIAMSRFGYLRSPMPADGSARFRRTDRPVARPCNRPWRRDAGNAARG